MALTTTKPAALCRSSKWAEGIQVAELSSAFPGAHWQVAVTGSRARHLDSGCRNIKQALNCCSTCPPHLYSFFSQKSGLLWFECWFPLQILMSSPDIERWTARVGALTEEVSECVLAFSINWAHTENVVCKAYPGCLDGDFLVCRTGFKRPKFVSIRPRWVTFFEK